MEHEKIQITYTYPGNGSTKTFPIRWPFIDRRYVKVFLSRNPADDTELYDKAEDITTLCAWLSNSQIEITPAPPSGSVVIITRQTPFDQTLATLTNGSNFLADDLNLINDQLLHIIQETKDYSQQVQDYVSGKYAEDAAESAKSAEDSATDAADSATAATASATAAKVSETNSAVSAGQAKSDANRAAQLVDPTALASSAFNVRKAQTLNGGAAGQMVDLLGYYYPTRDLLLLFYNGTVLTPLKPGVESTGNYSYEEVGDDPNAESNKVKLHFATQAGDVLDMFVVASAAGRNLEQIEAMVAEAAALAQAARVSETAAAQSAEAAQAAADTLPDINTASAGDTITAEAGPGGAMVFRLQPPSAGAPPQRLDTELAAPLAAGTVFTVPQYTVGAKKLTVYLDGLLCDAGENGLYLETGAAGSKSTTITLNDALEVGWKVTAIVAG